MTTSHVEYRLVSFEGRKASDADFVKALGIYAQYTPVSERIDSNEIVFWNERYNQAYSPDRLLLFGLQVNSEIVGFAEAVWLEK